MAANEAGGHGCGTGTESRCVLVVDDDADIREAVREILLDEGYLVLTAAHGREALELLRGVRPALILLDLAMPIMDGAAFREAQRQSPALASIPTVVMTAADRPMDRVAPLAPDETLAKPIRLDLLLATVARYCRR